AGHGGGRGVDRPPVGGDPPLRVEVAERDPPGAPGGRQAQPGQRNRGHRARARTPTDLRAAGHAGSLREPAQPAPLFFRRVRSLGAFPPATGFCVASLPTPWNLPSCPTDPVEPTPWSSAGSVRRGRI